MVVVKTLAYSDVVNPKFPARCVYCCAPSDQNVDLEFKQNHIIGFYTNTLQNQYPTLPITGGEITKGGFGVSVEGKQPGLGKRRISIECKIKGRVPYCSKHFALKDDIEKASLLPVWGYMASLVIGLISAALAVGSVIPPLFLGGGEWIDKFANIVVVFGIGVMVTLGVSHLLHRLFGDKGPSERVDYLKTPMLGGAEAKVLRDLPLSSFYTTPTSW